MDANTEHDDTQRTPGRRTSCCEPMTWALRCKYIIKGYMWARDRQPFWIPWRLAVRFQGGFDTSPIHYCPWCGRNLDVPED